MQNHHSGIRWTAIVLTAIALAACRHGADDAPPPRPVLVEHPQPFAGESGEVLPGTVRVQEEADLGFRVPGKIATRLVNAGQQVQAGQVLATLDPQDAALNLEAAEANAKLAEAELKRHRDLLNKGFISQSLYDVKENANKVAQANLAVVRNQSNYTTLTAGKPGLITAVLAEAGQVVAAGQPVLRFAASSAREVTIHVPEGRIEALKKSQQLAVTLWAEPSKRYAAKLREINLQADPATRTHEARVTIIGGDDIPLGTTATVLIGEKIDAALFSIPPSALGAVNGQPVVWIVGDDHAVHAHPVKVLRYTENATIIGAELSPAMNMVSAGTQLMVEGMGAPTLIQRVRPGTP